MPKGRKNMLKGYTDSVRKKLETQNKTSVAQIHDWLKKHHLDFPLFNQKTIFNFVHSVRIE